MFQIFPTVELCEEDRARCFALPLSKSPAGAGEVLHVPAEFCLPLPGMEWVDIQHRTFTGILTSIFWSIGNMVLALVAYLVREWHWLLVAVTGPCLLSIICVWWVQPKERKRAGICLLCGSYDSLSNLRTHLCPVPGFPKRDSSGKLEWLLGFVSPARPGAKVRSQFWCQGGGRTGAEAFGWQVEVGFGAASSARLRVKKRDSSKGRHNQIQALILSKPKIKNVSIFCPPSLGRDTFGTTFSMKATDAFRLVQVHLSLHFPRLFSDL